MAFLLPQITNVDLWGNDVIALNTWNRGQINLLKVVMIIIRYSVKSLFSKSLKAVAQVQGQEKAAVGSTLLQGSPCRQHYLVSFKRHLPYARGNL